MLVVEIATENDRHLMICFVLTQIVFFPVTRAKLKVPNKIFCDDVRRYHRDDFCGTKPDRGGGRKRKEKDSNIARARTLGDSDWKRSTCLPKMLNHCNETSAKPRDIGS